MGGADEPVAAGPRGDEGRPLVGHHRPRQRLRGLRGAGIDGPDRRPQPGIPRHLRPGDLPRAPAAARGGQGTATPASCRSPATTSTTPRSARSASPIPRARTGRRSTRSTRRRSRRNNWSAQREERANLVAPRSSTSRAVRRLCLQISAPTLLLSIFATPAWAQAGSPAPAVPAPGASSWSAIARLPDLSGTWSPDIPDQESKSCPTPSPGSPRLRNRSPIGRPKSRPAAPRGCWSIVFRTACPR